MNVKKFKTVAEALLPDYVDGMFSLVDSLAKDGQIDAVDLELAVEATAGAYLAGITAAVSAMVDAEETITLVYKDVTGVQPKEHNHENV